MIASTYSPPSWRDVQAIKVEPNIFGISGSASPNSTTNIDVKIDDDSLIKAITPIIQNMNFGDTIDLYVIDKDGVYAPANTVLKHPISSYYMQTSQQLQFRYESVAPFKLLGGVYLRFAYANVNLLVAAQVKINLELLKVLV